MGTGRRGRSRPGTRSGAAYGGGGGRPPRAACTPPPLVGMLAPQRMQQIPRRRRFGGPLPPRPSGCPCPISQQGRTPPGRRATGPGAATRRSSPWRPSPSRAAPRGPGRTRRGRSPSRPPTSRSSAAPRPSPWCGTWRCSPTGPCGSSTRWSRTSWASARTAPSWRGTAPPEADPGSSGCRQGSWRAASRGRPGRSTTCATPSSASPSPMPGPRWTSRPRRSRGEASGAA